MLIFCQRAVAQMPVEKEPFHKVVFENQNVRVIDLTIPPGDTTLAHVHLAGSIVVFLSKSKLAIRNEGQQPTITEVKPGNTVYRDYDERPIVHKVWSADKSAFHCLVVEVKKHELKDIGYSTLSMAGMRLLWKQKSVNAFQLDLPKGKKINLPKSICAYLLINFLEIMETISPEGKIFLRNGDFILFPPQSVAEISADDNGNSACILLQLK